MPRSITSRSLLLRVLKRIMMLTNKAGRIAGVNPMLPKNRLAMASVANIRGFSLRLLEKKPAAITEKTIGIVW